MVAMLLALAAAPSAPAAPPPALAAGETLRALPMAPGETRRYRVDKPAVPAAVLLRAEQHGVDVVLDAVAPDGAHLGPVDSPTDRDGAETLLIPATAPPGSYLVEVRAAPGAMPPGSVDVAAQLIATAGRSGTASGASDSAAGAGAADDLGGRRLAAEAAMTDAGRLFAAGGAEARRAAAARLEAALALWRASGAAVAPGAGGAAGAAGPAGAGGAVGDTAEEARTLYWLAQIRSAAGDSRQALDLYGQALPLWRSLGDAGREADTLTGSGLASWRLGDNERAIAAFDQALVIEERLGDFHRQAVTRSDACLVHHARGEIDQALACYEAVLASLGGRGEQRQEASLLLNAGAAYSSLGEPRQALERYGRALALLRAAHDRKQEAQALNNLAVVWSGLGEPDRALSAYDEALAIFRQTGDRAGEARALNNLGAAYRDLGQPERAADYFQQALALRHEIGDRRGEASTLDNLGDLLAAAGDHQRGAERARDALALYRAAADHNGEADALERAGREEVAAGNLRQGLATLEEAVAARRVTGDRGGLAAALTDLAEARAHSADPLDLANLDAAAAALAEALAIRRATTDPNGQIAVLGAIARLERQRRRAPAARAAAEEAIGLIESQRGAIAGPELRASFVSARQDAYETEIALLMEATGGDLRQALATNERARARALIDLVAESRAAPRRSPAVDAAVRAPLLLPLPPAVAEPAATDFAARRRALEERLRAKHRRRLELMAVQEASAAGRQLANREEQAVLRDLDQLDIVESAARPRSARLASPPPLAVPDIQRLLDSATVLVEVSLGDERSFLWWVEKDAVDGWALPGRAAIEEQARRLYAMWRTPRLDAAEAATARRAAAGLSRLLLGPAAGRLGDRRLVVVADGALVYLPFAALPDPADPDRPLAARHEVVSLPAASLLPLLRDAPARTVATGATVAIGATGAPPTEPPTALPLIVVADPVFSADDPRLHGEGAGPGTADRDVPRAAAATFPAALDRLPATRREAETIAALLPPGQARVELDFAASRERVLAGDLAPYRLIHLATHGLIDAEDPLLSGLALSNFDASGAPRDGFLSLGDIYGLRLSADLVVLSGCETALGKALRGEGLIGLVQGFFVAGARRVVASLWPVPERSTAELMGHFYRAMLADHLAPAAALRQAQLALAADRRWRDPYYWAAFELLGDWQ